MMNDKIGKRYAAAIYQIAEEKDIIVPVYEVLNQLLELFRNDREFRDFIMHPLVSKQEKENFLASIFKNYQEEILVIIDYVLEKGRISSIKAIVVHFLKIYYEKNQIVDVRATFTNELTSEQRERLIKTLEKKLKKEVNLTTKVDKKIIGGGVIRIGDEVYNGSIRNELEQLKKNNGL